MENQRYSTDSKYIEPVDRESPLIYMTAEKAGYMLDQLVNGFLYDVDGTLDLTYRSGYDELWREDDLRKFSSRFPDEIVNAIVKTDGKDHYDEKTDFSYGIWSEYWTGWMLTFVMDATSWTLPYILEAVSGRELENMYWPYHEMDVSKAIREVIRRVKDYYCG